MNLSLITLISKIIMIIVCIIFEDIVFHNNFIFIFSFFYEASNIVI